jgi:hypothetical protein
MQQNLLKSHMINTFHMATKHIKSYLFFWNTAHQFLQSHINIGSYSHSSLNKS